MPSVAEPSKVRTALRTAGIVVAVISAAIAVFLVVFSEASRSAQFGMLLGFWAALILAFSLVRGHDPVAAETETEEPSSELATVGPPPPTIEDLAAGMALELRRSAELERQNAEVERREFALKLELMLRREVEHVMTAQMASLRQEIAGLRGEILDNVGGQLRLERIETTRLIGSDVQALQQEIRRLADVREAMELSMDAEDGRIIDAQIVPDAEPEPEPLVEPEPAPEPEPLVEAPLPPEPEPEPLVEAPLPPEPEPEPAAQPVRRIFDFADLPSVARLTPLPPTPAASRYAGRRRAAGGDSTDSTDSTDSSGGDAGGGPGDSGEVPAPRSPGQRRAREDSDDVLARLLGR